MANDNQNQVLDEQTNIVEEKSTKPEQLIHSKSEGRDYLMNLLKK